MDFELTEEQREFKDLAARVINDKLKPIVLKLDEEQKYPSEFITEIGNLGFMGIFISEEYGGLGKGIFEFALVAEEVARVCLSAASSYGVVALGILPILLSGTEEQKKKYLSKIASGKALAAFAITEADAGSDVMAMKARATRDGDFYVLNGTKQFITSAGLSDIYSVFVKTNPERGERGVSGFIIEKGTPGLEFGRKESKLGIRASETRSLILTDCRVPAENLIGGKENFGAITILNTLNRSRIVVGALGVGCADGALEQAVAYAKERKQFGQSIASFQAIQHKLADMAVRVETARLLVYKAAWLADRANVSKSVLAKLGAEAKYFAANAACDNTDDAIQIFGGMGFMEESGIPKRWRDSRILRLYEGTDEILKNEIARILIKESAK